MPEGAAIVVEKMLLKYAAFQGRTLFGCLVKKRLETSKRIFFCLATSSAEIVSGQNNGISLENGMYP